MVVSLPQKLVKVDLWLVSLPEVLVDHDWPQDLFVKFLVVVAATALLLKFFDLGVVQDVFGHGHHVGVSELAVMRSGLRYSDLFGLALRVLHCFPCL